VPLEVLWEALNTVDTDNGKLRGYLRLERLGNEALLWSLEEVKYPEWKDLAVWLEKVPGVFEAKVREVSRGYKPPFMW